ncbi:ATPase [Methanobrevibacter sp. DSM 116169]|uniref:ATPase n=1 Tax=Methanobrevibacter sp. DSM 116169 TaxID=3242727 RepID=UPI0038FCA754
MDLNFDILPSNEEFTSSKKDILKFLKIIGIDSRYISYTDSKIYINNLRFSKFSKTKEKTFKKHYPDIEVLRSSLFQKICARSSKVLSDKLKPQNTVLLPSDDEDINRLLEIVLEPYSRKYGIKLVYSGSADFIASPKFLDEEVSEILTDIFNGNGIDFINDEKVIYPFINIPKEWLNSFLEMEGFNVLKENDIEKDVASSFMDFMGEILPSYRENVLVSYEYIKSKIKE